MRSGNIQRRIADMELQMMQGTGGADWQRCYILMHGMPHIEYAQHVTTGERIYDPAVVRQMFNPSGKTGTNQPDRPFTVRLDMPKDEYAQIITEAQAAGLIADSQIRSMLRISPQGQP